MFGLLSKLRERTGTAPSEPTRDNEAIVSGLVGEVLFAALPLFLIVTVFTDQQRFMEVFSSPEWSFGSAILFGQTIAKLDGGRVRTERARPGAYVLVKSLLIVVGLAPALAFNQMIFRHITPPDHPSGWLATAQVLDFAAAAFFYVVLGRAAAHQ